MDAETIILLLLAFTCAGFFAGLVYEAAKLVRRTSGLVKDAHRARDKVWLDAITAVMQTHDGRTTADVVELLKLVEMMGVKR